MKQIYNYDTNKRLHAKQYNKQIKQDIFYSILLLPLVYIAYIGLLIL